MSGVRWTDLLSEYSTKERVISPTFFILKVPFEVRHECGTAHFQVGMYYWDPFQTKRRSLLDPVSSSTLIVFFLTMSLTLLIRQVRIHILIWIHMWRIYQFPGIAFRELWVLSPETRSIATTAVTFPVSEFSIAISLDLIVSSASLVALIGRVSVDSKWMPEGCSNF